MKQKQFMEKCIFAIFFIAFAFILFACGDKTSEYEVIFKDYDGTVLKELVVEEGEDAIAPSNPAREGYVFTGWDTAYDDISSDLIVTAEYVRASYTVVFKDYDGSILKTMDVLHGDSAVAPSDPYREGFDFAGWDISLENITSDTNITANYTEENLWMYEKSDGKVTILGYEDDTITNLVIPNTIEGLPVTHIDDEAFYQFSLLQSIDLPNTLQSIGDRSFSQNTALESITIPNSVIEIGSQAFYNARSVVTLTFEDGCQLSTIPLKAFYGLSSLTSLIIPNSIISIGESAFEGSSSLISLVVPANVQTIGSKAFKDAIAIEEITLSSGLTSIGSQAFEALGLVTTLVVPDSVEDIGEGAFGGMNALTEITLPFMGRNREYSFSKFGYAFGDYYDSGKSYYADSYYLPNTLETVTLTDISSIASNAFYEAEKIKQIIIHGEVTTIGSRAFAYTTDLTSITFDEEFLLESIGDEAFHYSGIQSIQLPETLQTIGMYAFADTSLTSITIPSAITSISQCAFYNIPTLTEVIFEEESELVEIGNDAFGRAVLLQSIIFPEGLTAIGESAFEYNESLTTIVVPDTVESIGKYAFANTTSLTSITLPFVGTNRAAIGNDGKFGYIFGDYHFDTTGTYSADFFYYPLSLKEVTITDADFIRYAAFKDVYTLEKITLPFIGHEGSTDDDIGGLFGYIFGRETFNTTHMYSAYECWYPKALKEIVITGGSIVDYAAFGLATSLESITLPESIMSIGISAFYGCTALVSVNIPHSITSISQYTFYDCYSLESITIPEGVTIINDEAFYGCASLISVYIPNTVTMIRISAFDGASSLESVYIPESVTYIGDYAFGYCDSLTIYAEVSSQPNAWSQSWNSAGRPVYWNSERP